MNATRCERNDLVELWAEAEDNKAPEPNRTETPHLKIRIGSPQSQQDQLADARDKQRPPPEAAPPDAGEKNGRDQQRQPGAAGENRPDQPPPEGERDQQNAGQKQSSQQDGAQGAPPHDQRVDPDDPGKAIEKLNEDSKQPPQPGEKQQAGDNRQQNSDKQNADQQNPAQVSRSRKRSARKAIEVGWRTR